MKPMDSNGYMRMESDLTIRLFRQAVNCILSKKMKKNDGMVEEKMKKNEEKMKKNEIFCKKILLKN